MIFFSSADWGGFAELSRPRSVIHERSIAFLARVSRFALFASNIICLFCRLQKDFRRIVRFSLATVHSRVTVPCLCRVSRKRFSGHCAGIIGCGIEREWSLRAFASMWAVRVFANTTWPGIKFILRAASTLKIPDGEQRALLVGISLLLKSYLKETWPSNLADTKTGQSGAIPIEPIPAACSQLCVFQCQIASRSFMWVSWWTFTVISRAF